MTSRQYLSLLASSLDRTTGKSVSPQRLKNMFLEEYITMSGTMKYSAYGCPGIAEWITLSEGNGRGMFVHNDTLYAASGTKVYSIDRYGVSTVIGTIDAAPSVNEEKVSIAGLNDYILFCGNNKVWSYKISTGAFAQITDVDFPFDEVEKVLSFGEYAIYLIKDTQTIYVADLSDPASVQADSFFNAESSFDNIVGGAVAQNYLYIFGTVTTEIFYNAGGALIPFSQVVQGHINYGCGAKNSINVVNNEVYFLGQDPNGLVGLMKFSGAQPSVIPNRSFNEKVKSFTETGNAFSFVSVHNGHQFYYLTFPKKTATRAITFVYDVTTDSWHEREMWNPNALITPGYDGHIAQTSVYFNNKQYIIDRFSGVIYELSMDIYDDNSYPIIREIITPYIYNNENFLSCFNLEVDVERSTALAAGQGSDPQLTLFYSTDRTGTWEGGESQSMGLVGEYRNKLSFGSLGGGYSFTYKIQCSEPISVVIHGITAEIESESKAVVNG